MDVCVCMLDCVFVSNKFHCHRMHHAVSVSTFLSVAGMHLIVSLHITSSPHDMTFIFIRFPVCKYCTLLKCVRKRRLNGASFVARAQTADDGGARLRGAEPLRASNSGGTLSRQRCLRNHAPIEGGLSSRAFHRNLSDGGERERWNGGRSRQRERE